MNKPFVIKELTIKQMPGFSNGLAPLARLSPHINIITGPNASGKSSTARLIHSLLWKKQAPGNQAAAYAAFDDRDWSLAVDWDTVRVQQEGHEKEIPGLPARDSSGRYMLGLRELLVENDQDLASSIARESAGGYDVDKAARALNYYPAGRSAQIAEHKNLRSARQAYEQKKAEQERLRDDELRLDELEQEKEAARQSQQLHNLYGLLAEYLEASQQAEAAQSSLEQFPQVLAKATGEEPEEVKNIARQLTEARQALAAAEKERLLQQQIIEKLNLPPGGVSAHDLLTLDQEISNAADTQKTLSIKKSQLETARIEKQQALLAVDQDIDTARWQGLALEDVGQLEQFLQHAQQVVGEKEALEAEIRILEAERNTLQQQQNAGLNQTGSLQEGISILSNWLREQKSFFGVRPLWIVVLAAMAAATALISALTPWGLLGLLAVAALALVAWSEKPARQTLPRQHDFINTGLTPPPAWQHEEVAQRLKELIDELNDALALQKLEQRIDSLQGRREAIHEKQEKVDHKAGALRQRIGAMPASNEGDTPAWPALYWFVVNVRDWQKAHALVMILDKECQQLEAQLATHLAEANRILVSNQAQAATTVAQARASHQLIRQAAQQFHDATRQIDWNSNQRDEKQQLITTLKEAMDQVYRKLELEPGNPGELSTLCARLPHYRQAQQNSHNAGVLLTSKEGRLTGHSLFGPDMKALSPDEVQLMMHEEEQKAASYDGLVERISQIRTRVADASGAGNMEQALLVLDKATEELENEYHTDLGAIAGSLIVKHLKQESHDNNKHVVFREASAIFSDITSGRYELRLDDHGQEGFRAYDTVTRQYLPLDHLSAATRIQLLLSVRLGYITSVESGTAMPLLADELCANSDDVRAVAIIQALARISQQGRQIFYFTAQADELRKWEALLKDYPEGFLRVVSLGQQAGSSPLEEISVPDLREPDTALPAHLPDHEQKRWLKLQPFSLLQHHSSQLHLWYLTSDTTLLNNCLAKNIRYWGQLRSFFSYQGRLQGLSEDAGAQMQQMISLLERYQELYRQGRPQIINPQHLKDSGAVTPAYIEAVCSKLDELQGNPVELLEALRSRQVKGFGPKSVNALEQYLNENNYLPQGQPFTPAEIELQLRAFISHLGISPQRSHEFLARVMGTPEG